MMQSELSDYFKIILIGANGDSSGENDPFQAAYIKAKDVNVP